MLKEFLLGIIFAVSLIPVASAAPFELSDHGMNFKLNGELITLGNLTVQIWDSELGGNLIFEENFTDAVVNGAWAVMVGKTVPLELNYSTKYWKDYKINNVDQDYGLDERLEFYSPLGNIPFEYLYNFPDPCPDGQYLYDINETNFICREDNVSNMSDTNCSVDNSCPLITYDSELNYTTDTNASTKCGDGQVLQGNGSCVDWIGDGGTVEGNVTLKGSLTIIGDTINATVIEQYMNGTFFPSITNFFNLGSDSWRWNNFFINTIDLITLLTDAQIENDITANASKLTEKENLVNSHLHACQNVTGAVSNLCTIIDTDTHVAGDGDYLTNDSDTMYWNETKGNETINSIVAAKYLNLSGTNANQNIDVAPYNLTVGGALLSSGDLWLRYVGTPGVKITASGDVYTYGTLYNDGDIVQSNEYWLYNSLALKYPYFHAYSGGATVWNTTDPVINLTSEGNYIGIGNMSIDGHYDGQPMEGSIGSGVIWCDDIDSSGNINITHPSGTLNITYPNMIVRLSKSDNTVIYCNIVEGNVTVPDETHSVYYVDFDCSIKQTTIANYIVTDLSPGGLTDIFNTMAHSGDIEVHKGITVKNKETIKVRKNLFKTVHLDVVSGFGITTETFNNFSIDEGEYVYIRDISNATKQNTSDGANVEMVYHDAGNWDYSDNVGLNLTHCDNTTDLIECSNPSKIRRYFIFITGFSDGCDTTELHQLAADDDTYYSNVADCLDVLESPITYTLPDHYTYTAVILFAYCGIASDEDWEGLWIDLRTVVTGTSTTDIDTSIFLTRDGTRTLTDDWDVGGLNATNLSWVDAVIGNFTEVRIGGEPVTGDNTTWNQTLADTLYAVLGYGDDWNKTYADTLYDALGSANSSFNQTLTDALYTYSAGNGISLAGTVFSVAGNNCLTQDADGLSVTADCIGDTQLEFNTGQNLTNTSNPTFNNATITDCVVFASGGMICSGS